MTTASDIITDALGEIGYQAAETPVEAADMELGLRKLNDMFASWAESGINLGATPVENPADIVRIPRGAVEAVKLNLAGKLAASFRKQITPELAASIKASTDALIRSLVKPINPHKPSTLPLGSGNQYDNDVDDIRFFKEQNKVNF